ncbi:MAG: hypothetical protein Ct9H300mP31_11010 [Acidimicrobiaceae bacterium]|nr:MAG: hypothetical protein Ct9H300mP31_11010 [Acidimicrobiaceae bacterium]
MTIAVVLASTLPRAPVRRRIIRGAATSSGIDSDEDRNAACCRPDRPGSLSRLGLTDSRNLDPMIVGIDVGGTKGSALLVDAGSAAVVDRERRPASRTVRPW